MKTALLLLMTLSLSVLTSCDKEDEAPAIVPAVAVTNSYTFLNDTIDIINAEYSFYNGDTFIKFKGETTDDYVHVRFANRTGIVPVGAFTYHGDRNSGYIVQSNFVNGAISHISDQLDYYATGGSVIITAEPNGMHKVSFLLVTESGTAKGEYTGLIKAGN